MWRSPEVNPEDTVIQKLLDDTARRLTDQICGVEETVFDQLVEMHGGCACRHWQVKWSPLGFRVVFLDGEPLVMIRSGIKDHGATAADRDRWVWELRLIPITGDNVWEVYAGPLE